MSIPGARSRFWLRFDFRLLGVNFLLLGTNFGPVGANFRPFGVVLDSEVRFFFLLKSGLGSPELIFGYESRL